MQGHFFFSMKLIFPQIETYDNIELFIISRLFDIPLYNPYLPNFVINRIQLFLQHQRQRLRVSVPIRRQHIGATEYTFIIVAFDITRYIERLLHIRQDMSLL